MMKKQNYFAPAIEELLVVVENGIAQSNGGFVDGSNPEEDGDDF